MLAGATVVIPIMAVVSICIRGSVTKRTALPVSASWTFAALFVAYYGLVAIGADWGGNDVAIAPATAVLVRLVAIRRRPLWRLVIEAIPLPLRRPLVLAVAALAAATVLTGATYAVSHPLVRGPSGGSASSGSTAQYAFSIRNGAFVGLTVTSLRLRGADGKRFVVTDFRKGFDGRWPREAATISHVSIPRYSERVLILSLRGRCPSSRQVPAPAVELSYRLLGRSFRQFVRLDTGSLDC